MDVLVIGGTVFVGQAVVRQALARGDRVTVFHRGRSGSVPQGAQQILGDRGVSADLDQLAGRRFDLVVDTCGYVPREVTASARLLIPAVGRYAFVSTINVFPGWPDAPDYHLTGEHHAPADASREDAPAETAYGWLKSGCEQAVREAFGEDRSAVLRAGCIVGPDDSAVGRLPWWIDRLGRAGEGGAVLAPGDPADPVALLDARDLADFALSGVAGTFEVTGIQVGRAELLAACAQLTGSTAELIWVEDSWLAEQDVQPWTEIPLWAPRPGAPSLFRHDPAEALAAGLRRRPLDQTVGDTWRWQRSVPGGWRPTTATPGLAAAKERDLLRRWADRTR